MLILLYLNQGSEPAFKPQGNHFFTILRNQLEVYPDANMTMSIPLFKKGIQTGLNSKLCRGIRAADDPCLKIIERIRWNTSSSVQQVHINSQQEWQHPKKRLYFN